MPTIDVLYSRLRLIRTPDNLDKHFIWTKMPRNGTKSTSKTYLDIVRVGTVGLILQSTFSHSKANLSLYSLHYTVACNPAPAPLYRSMQSCANSTPLKHVTMYQCPDASWWCNPVSHSMGGRNGESTPHGGAVPVPHSRGGRNGEPMPHGGAVPVPRSRGGQNGEPTLHGGAVPVPHSMGGRNGETPRSPTICSTPNRLEACNKLARSSAYLRNIALRQHLRRC